MRLDSRSRADLAATTVGVAMVALALLYEPVVRELVSVWSEEPYDAYGMLVPVVSAFLLWSRRRAFHAAPLAWRIEGLLVMVTALALLAVGVSLDSLAVQTLSLPVALAGLSLFTLGRRRTRILALPLGFLVMMTPLPAGAMAVLSPLLRHLAVRTAYVTLVALGIPAAIDGLVLRLGDVTLPIGEACNGLRFLLIMLVFGVAYAATTQTRALHRALVVAAAVAVAIAGNLVRVAGTAVYASAAGAETAMSGFHLAYGRLIYALMLIPFFALVLALRHRGRATRRQGGRRPAALRPARTSLRRAA